jgi:hypothetical protein
MRTSFAVTLFGAACLFSFVVVDIPIADAAKLNCSAMRKQCVRSCHEWTETWSDYEACRGACLGIHGVCVAINKATSVHAEPTPPPDRPRPGGATQPGILDASPGFSPQGPAGAGSPAGTPPASRPAVIR